MAGPTESSPRAVLERLHRALNDHDLEAFLTCFDPDYDSEQPAHPNRRFRGREQVRTNWSALFSGIPDFGAELLRSAVEGDTAWAEWHWTGTQAGGTRLDEWGVTLFGVRDGRIAWGRLYMEEVEAGGAAIDEVVQQMREGDGPQR